MRLLEKDVHDKQDTLMSLRKQLEDVKKINIDLHSKWQVSVKYFPLSLFTSVFIFELTELC